MAKDCNNKKSCQIKDLRSYMPDSQKKTSDKKVTLAAQIFSSKDDSKNSAKDKKGPEMDESECLGELASIFIQVGCVLPD